MKKYLAEALGTFVLVFCGTCTIVLNAESGGVVTYLDIALAFGLSVMLMVYFFRRISGAYINPAITIAAVLARRLSKRNLLPYLVAQISGAILASVLLRAIFPNDIYLGTTRPLWGEKISFVVEFVITFILMMVVLNSNGRLTGVVVGSVVGIEAYIAGNISGASMNPARSMGPAIVSGHYEYLWLYIAAPIAGAVLAVYANKLVNWKNA